MQNPEDIGHERLPSYFYSYKVKQKKNKLLEVEGGTCPQSPIAGDASAGRNGQVTEYSIVWGHEEMCSV